MLECILADMCAIYTYTCLSSTLRNSLINDYTYFTLISHLYHISPAQYYCLRFIASILLFLFVGSRLFVASCCHSRNIIYYTRALLFFFHLVILVFDIFRLCMKRCVWCTYRIVFVVDLPFSLPPFLFPSTR